MRKGGVTRKTKETEIEVRVDLDGTGAAKIATGIGFFDHMLEQLARHSLIDIEVRASGDLHIDQHHTVEDTGIALGQAMRQALGDMAGISRFADAVLPMDEALTRVAVDISGRPFPVIKTKLAQPKIGAFDSELVREFFQAFATHAAMNIHVETLYGENAHHIAESAFKGLARALRCAIEIDQRQKGAIPSTKGSLAG
jgi:imidazoleglycerol-phosphate dehydratase